MAEPTSITVGIKTAVAVNAVFTCVGVTAGSAVMLWLGRGIYRDAHAEGVRQGRRAEQDLYRRQALGLPLTKTN